MTNPGILGARPPCGQERHLEHAVDYFGAERDLASITTADVRTWCEELQVGGLSAGTARHYLNALSNLYRRARAERVVPSGYDPVGDLLEKPTARRAEAKWLEVPEAALLVEAARTHVPKRSDLAVPFAYPLIAAFLLTGGRRAEVLGLEVGDVSFDRKMVTFRPNDWRRLKTATSLRSVPLWPQLEEILRAYVFGAGKPPGRLLFPCYKTGEEAMLTDLRKLLDAAGTRAGWQPGEIRSKMFRHTYTAARLQTLDEGAPVSVYTVAKELGHGGEAMVRRVYGHLGQMRHRASVVEYRVEQHRKALAERLTALGLAPPLAPR
jgi:integrase